MNFLKYHIFSLFILCTSFGCSSSKIKSDAFLVKDGKANAEIIISKHPTRSVKFAAKEFQDYIFKITGATLPIHSDDKTNKTQNSAKGNIESFKNKIYIGQSLITDSLGIKSVKSDWGGFKIQSGDHWISLLGHDTDFKPRGIWAKSRNDWQNNVIEEWEDLTNHAGWQNPIGSRMWQRYNKQLDLWAYDKKGSLNAVYEYLRRLGVRWFIPGEEGEIIPKLKDIKITEINDVVEPKFKIRKASFVRYGNGKIVYPDILWSLRQGLNDRFGFDMYHGMSDITRSEKNRKEHPEYYALYDGKRSTSGKTPEHCLSSEGLFEENLRYLRLMFDMYDVPSMSVWPDDGYSRICECDKCVDKATPERGREGLLSDYVWEYVNNIAIEIEKTHPNKFIIGGAYSTYFLPPEKIEKLNSNVMVHVVNPRRRYKRTPEYMTERLAYLNQWNKLSGQKLISFMNHGHGANTPNVFLEDIENIKNLVNGEDMWVPHRKGGGLDHPAFYHLNYYISARMWWNPDMNKEEFLDEYFNLFYGPAAEKMRNFINYYEIHQSDFNKSEKAEILKEGIELFKLAKRKCQEGTIYHKRITLFEKGIEKFYQRYNQIKIERKNFPSIRAIAPTKWVKDLKIDGNLNEVFWKNIPYRLKDNFTGKHPKYSTRFKIGFNGNNLYVGISCEIEKNKPLAISTLNNDNPEIWDGDYIDLLLESPSNSYYQISINPAGVVTDFDRGNPDYGGFRWQSEIQLGSKVDQEKGVWTIEVKIPISNSDQDPLHEVIGFPPKNNFTWFFNICRKYNIDDKIELSAFSPTKNNSFLDNRKFGELRHK